MSKDRIYRYQWIFPALILALIIAGCSRRKGETADLPTSSPTPALISSTPEPAEATPEPVQVDNGNALYVDRFTDPATGWPEAKFDNYFIGYHEPEYYHIEITSPNYKTTVFEPEKLAFDDFTLVARATTASGRTAETGDFAFGPVFRRSGDQYYAFTISQRAKKWYVLKSTPNALSILAQGGAENIHDADVEDTLRVDAQGSTFTFSINDQPVGQVTDADYASGEIGVFVQTFDAANVHVHFDDLTILPFEGVPFQVADPGTLYQDRFTNPASGWSEAKFDNYFIGYHEPEYYHVEITSPNYKTTVFEPKKLAFEDFTLQVKATTASSRTAETGDFSFGPVFRRSGDQYYAFGISQRTKKWYVLKSAPNSLSILAEGGAENIHDADVEDTLRVDAQGSTFTFSINDQPVGQVTDADYASGEIGVFVQTLDAANVHVHFDELTILPFEGVPFQAPDPGTLYQDVFTNPASGWPEAKFDNYYIGYHEPEYYHVEITSPNYKTTVFEPKKLAFDDFTLQVKATTASSRTAETGDFSFGPVFRRSGDQYYAFGISQRTKKWYVLKSAPNSLSILAEGSAENIYDADVEDTLRVDAHGSSFSFSINDQLVGQVTDADYASGEIGVFVQTLDAANVHVHFDELAISAFEPSLACEVKVLFLNVRSGPGIEHSSIGVLTSGDTVEPLGRSADGDWLLIALDDNGKQSWIFNSREFLTCNAPVDGLPVTSPGQNLR